VLYIIQQHTFQTIMERLRERLATTTDPEQRIRIFVDNHVGYSIAKHKAMKVLAHEDDVLKNGYGAELAEIKREYYRICLRLVEEFAKAEGSARAQRVSSRTAVLSLFGMMNWLYTWYRPGMDSPAEVLSREIADVFLVGIRGGGLMTGKLRAGAKPRSVEPDNKDATKPKKGTSKK
jgi:hypothetical protein